MAENKTGQTQLDTRTLRTLLGAYRAGEVDETELLDAITSAASPSGFAESMLGRFDTEREARTGIPEAIFAEGKSVAMIVDAFTRAHERGEQLIATRLTAEQVTALEALQEERGWRLELDALTGIASTQPAPTPRSGTRSVIVLAAGTSDLKVAEEAAQMCALFGLPTSRLYDVGVAGIHRLFHDLDRVREADIVIVAAGMDGALPSVVAGLVKAPVIAVPTSVGYGASFGGVSALLTMLNSCAPGVSVCNIDNGFGAAVLAKKMANMR